MFTNFIFLCSNIFVKQTLSLQFALSLLSAFFMVCCIKLWRKEKSGVCVDIHNFNVRIAFFIEIWLGCDMISSMFVVLFGYLKICLFESSSLLCIVYLCYANVMTIYWKIENVKSTVLLRVVIDSTFVIMLSSVSVFSLNQFFTALVNSMV